MYLNFGCFSWDTMYKNSHSDTPYNCMVKLILSLGSKPKMMQTTDEAATTFH